MADNVKTKAKIHLEGWINRVDGTREMIFGETEELDEQACIDAGIPKRSEAGQVAQAAYDDYVLSKEKSDGTDS